ncbi:MAG: rRNA maturation RNase YbeY [bacterium]|nr:rRNA maturation RNase YbeY [bacterium]
MPRQRPKADGADPHPFPQPELDDPDSRSSGRLDVALSGSRVRVNRRLLRRVVSHALAAEGVRPRELTLALLDPEEMRAANCEFHGLDEATDHLGFQYEAPPGEVSGDILICPEVCVEQAVDYGETPRRELARVAIHGVLHLCGWRDDHPSRRRRMRAREDELLAGLDLLPGIESWLKGGRHAG